MAELWGSLQFEVFKIRFSSEGNFSQVTIGTLHTLIAMIISY